MMVSGRACFKMIGLIIFDVYGNIYGKSEKTNFDFVFRSLLLL